MAETYLTRDGYKKLQDNLKELKQRKQVLSREIGEAREKGDLKENAEYHIAKDDQAHLETRIKRLRARLRDAVVVEKADDDTFAFGRTAEVVEEDSGTTHRWTIVGPTEANVSEGKLSSESPVASALLGRAPGEVVEVETPRGVRSYRIDKLLL